MTHANCNSFKSTMPSIGGKNYVQAQGHPLQPHFYTTTVEVDTEVKCPTSKKVSTREDQPSTRRARFDGQARNNCKNDIVLPGVEQSAEQRWRDAVEQSPQSICKFLGRCRKRRRRRWM